MTKREKNDKLTDDMKVYLRLQYKICQDLGERAQLFAEGLKTTESSISSIWEKMKTVNTVLVKNWTPDQQAILIAAFEANPKFQPSQIAHKLGLDPKNKKDMRRIYDSKNNWKNKKNPR